MGNLKDYDGICNAIASAQNEDEPKNGLAIIEEIESMLTSKVRSKKLSLNEAEKQALLTLHIPDVKEKLLGCVEKTERKPKSKKKTKKESTSLLSSDYEEDDYSYNFDLEEENDDTATPVMTWEDMNPDELSYPVWLHEIGLREFFSLSHDVLYKIAACVCMMHSAAIPGAQKGIITKPELPKVLCYGVPGSGKSTYCDWVGNHYEREQDEEFNAFQTVMDTDSLKGLRDTIDRACNLGDGVLREACVHIDDFEPRYIANGGIWSKSKGLFLNVNRGQAISRVSVNGSKEKEAQSLFYSWALMLLSTNNHPKELFSLLPKMERRCIVIPFEKIGSRSLGEYSWQNLRGEYKQYWNKKRIEQEFWRGILRPLLRRSFSDYKYLKPEHIARSITLIAVGTFTGIFSSVEEAEKHVAEYWDYIGQKTSEGYEDLFLSALQSYVNDFESTGETMRSKLGRSKRYIEIAQEKMLEKVSGVSAMSPREKEAKMLGFMRLRGYSIIQRVNSQGEIKNFFLKYLES